VFARNGFRIVLERPPRHVQAGFVVLVILEIHILDVDCNPLRRLHCRNVNRNYANMIPQAVSVWSRGLGHETFCATCWAQADPKSLLPGNRNVAFLSAYTSASALGRPLAGLYRKEGALTGLGG
jgi:hypothetical protein